jgi:PEGA domain-containing protein
MRRAFSRIALVVVFAAVAGAPALAAGRDQERAGADAAAAHYALGNQAFQESDFARAVEELTASLAARPSLRAYLLRGDADVKLSRFDEARADYEAALRLEPQTRKRAAIERSIRDLATATQTRLLVTSDPPGATVYIDLKAAGKRGVTPLVVQTSPGRHRVFLELEGYDPLLTREVNAVEDHETKFAATLVVKGCDLRISATPAGATVAVDGGQAQAVPTTVRVRGGEHSVRLLHPSALPRQKTVTCVIGTSVEVSEALDAIPPGRLVVALQGVGAARLRVDGGTAGGLVVAVPPGDHRVSIDAPDRESWETGVHIDSGQEVRLAPRLVERGRSARKAAIWLWTGVGVAVAGVAVGLGVGLGVGLSGTRYPAPTIGDTRVQ